MLDESTPVFGCRVTAVSLGDIDFLGDGPLGRPVGIILLANVGGLLPPLWIPDYEVRREWALGSISLFPSCGQGVADASSPCCLDCPNVRNLPELSWKKSFLLYVAFSRVIFSQQQKKDIKTLTFWGWLFLPSTSLDHVNCWIYDLLLLQLGGISWHVMHPSSDTLITSITNKTCVNTMHRLLWTELFIFLE